MANFIVVVDEDADRRRRFVDTIRPMLDPVGGLQIGQASLGPFVACWAARADAPTGLHADAEVAAVLWGDAIRESGPPVGPKDIASAWPAQDDAPPAFGGFHAAALFHASRGLVVSGDLLGLFPLYYGVRHGAIVAGSSPELFRHHPLFPVEVDRGGLIGLLVTHAPFRGRTLLRGLRRVGPGRALHWSAERGAREVVRFAPTVRNDFAGTNLREQVEAVDGAFARAVERHAPAGGAYGVLLSGGRDSRMMAGYLRRRGTSAVALTFGDPDDYEMRCAKRVAAALAFHHRAHSIPQASFERCADLQSRWEHLATGFSSIHMWDAIGPLRELPPRTVNGYVRFREDEELPTDFETFLASLGRGVPAADLENMLGFPGAADLLRGTLADIRASYEESSSAATERPWRFRLAHLGRSHSGGVAWRLTFGSWPVMPILDRELIDLLASLPAASLARRRLQDELLRTRFPALAALPVDRNSPDVEPLLPSLRYRLARRAHALRAHVRRGAKKERRYYYRLYDFNGPGWRAVRRRAEPYRERLFDLFEPAALARYLPGPEIDVAFRQPIDGAFGPKLLVGLMLWAGDHIS